MRSLAKSVALFFSLIVSVGIAGAQNASWGDGQGNGWREGLSSAPETPCRMAFDGDSSTFWALEPGSDSGWIEAFQAERRELPGLTVDATLSEGASLRFSVLKGGHWVGVTGGVLAGPFDGKTTIAFPRDLGTTDRYLVTLEGERASEARVRSLAVLERPSAVPLVKIAPKSYTLNQSEYVNLKASRLWDGILGNAWFEPLWSLPDELSRSAASDKEAGVFPPFRGNPPKEAQIVWELDGEYLIRTLKASFLQSYRSVRFEFWNGSVWMGEETFGSRWSEGGAGLHRIDLEQPIATSRIRISFPGGWERARYIGEIEVWGEGWGDREIRPLALSDAGGDGARLFTLEDVDDRTWTLEVVADGGSSVPLAGDWNGHGFAAPAFTWRNGQTSYRVAVDRAWLREGTQFLRLQGAAAVRNARLLDAADDGSIDMGWPHGDGFMEETQSGPNAAVPAWEKKTWELGCEHELELVRVSSSNPSPLRLKTGLPGRRGRIDWKAVEWSAQGEGWWEARLSGVRADRLELESPDGVPVDEIRLAGTPLTDRKIGIELWWPKKGTSSGDDAVIGWLGNPEASASIGSYRPRQADKLFWMPLSQLGLEDDDDQEFSLEGRWGDARSQERVRLRRSASAPGTFAQGETFLATLSESLTVSGTVKDARYRVFVNGSEVPLSKYAYSAAVPLADGYQEISVEIRDRTNRKRLIAWTKEVYKASGAPALATDLPYGDLYTQVPSFTLTGRAGNGTGLSLTVDGTAVPLAGNGFEHLVELSEGTRTFRLALTDSLGRKTERTLAVTRDASAPRIAIDYPLPEEYLASAAFELSASAEGEAGLWWKVNEEGWIYDSGHPHVAPYVLADGFYRYVVVAQDAAGNVSDQASVSFTVDTTAPERFDILLDVSGWTTNTRPTASFSTADAVSGVDRYEYSVDGSEWQPASSPLALPSLSDGVHRLLVRAVDRAGNGTTESIDIFTDTTAPEDFLPTVDVSDWTSNTRPTVTFSTTDAVSAVAYYQVRIDDGEWTTQESPYQVPEFADGTHLISVAAVDLAGNSVAAPPVAVYTDATAPLPFSAAADVSGWTANQRPTFRFSTSDATSGVSRYEVKIDDGEWTTQESPYQTPTLADGVHTVTVKAADYAGNETSAELVAVYIDTAAPAAFTPTADASGWTANARPTMSFATTDATSGVRTYQVSIDGGGWSTQTSPYQVPALTDGTHAVAVMAIDAAGNAAVSGTLSLQIDTTAPLSFTTTLNVSGWTANNRPTATFATTDAVSGVARYEIRLDGGEWTPRASPYRFPSLSDGIHTASVRAVDQAGNAAESQTLTLKIDTAAPAAFAATANVSGWTPNNRPTVSFSTADEVSGVEYYDVRIDDGGWTVQKSPYRLPALADGTHAVSVRAYDRAANWTAAEPLSLYIDTTPPEAVQDFRLVPGVGRMEILWTTTDTDVVVYHLLRTEGETAISSFDTVETSRVEEGLTAGTVLSFSVQAEDRAGNLGPVSVADAAAVGIAASPLSRDTQTATVVEFQNVFLVVPPVALPEDVKAVLINEVESEELEAQSANPIVGPIYSFSTLQDDGEGNLVETSHTEFENEVLVSLDYDQSLVPNGFPESNLGVYYYDTLWSKWFRVEKAAIDIEQNKIVFFTNHFTNFSVQPTLIEDLKPQELKDSGRSPYKSESVAGEVIVSPQGGTMMTEAVEFVLKGKNGYAFPVKRIYDTQTARLDSPSMNLAMSLGINFGLTDTEMLFEITRQLVSGGVNLSVDEVFNKLISVFKKNGDYPYAMGIGWRLNLPYVISNDTSVMVRLPSGSYYPINQMSARDDPPVASVARSITFDNHRGEDFTFTVHQTRGNIVNAMTGLAGAGKSSLVESLTKILTGSDKPNNDGSSILSEISLAADFVSWTTVASELVLKDGTTYVFDLLGRVSSIRDPSGANVVDFRYRGFVLDKIVDAMGNETTFEYNNDEISGFFMRPSITKIETRGPENTTRSSRFEYDTGDHVAASFMTLPPMTAAWDVGGRKTSYGIDKRFLFTGGGYAKVNFLAGALSLLQMDFLSNVFGLKTLTISGHINLEWPRLIDRIEAPGAGVTEIDYKKKSLSDFDTRPSDFFLGCKWLPTALKISYEFLYRIITESVTVRNGELARTTTYDYHFTPRDTQWLVDRTTIDDGLSRTTQSYSIESRTYNRFVSIDDALVSAAKQGFFTEESNTETEYYPLAVRTTTAEAATGKVYQIEDTTWDAKRSRPLARKTTRDSAYVQDVSYAYDDWGNQTSVTTARTTPQGSDVKTERSWYWGTSSVAPAGFPAGFPTTPAQEEKNAKGLLLAKAVTTSKPSAYFGQEQETVYRAYAYDTLSRPVAEGIWTGDHWAIAAKSYYPVTAPNDPSSGLLRETTSPAGQRTTYAYDFSSLSHRSLWVETKTSHAVADPSGASSDVVEETAYDRGTYWPRLSKTPEGNVTETRYDVLGRPVSIVKPGDETPSPVGSWPAIRVNAPWDRIAYDDGARTAALYRETATGADPAAAKTQSDELYQYDPKGNLVAIAKYERTTGAASVTRAAYDAHNRVVSLSDPLGNTTGYTYDFLSRQTSVTHPDGASASTVYDDQTGKKESVDERGTITREFLSWAGRPEKTVADYNGLNVTTLNYYDALDRPCAAVDPLNQTTLTWYSPFGAVSRIQRPPLEIYESPEVLPDSVPTVSTTAITPMELTSYDDEGRPVSVKTGYEGNWRTVTATYDGLGRAIKKDENGRETWTWYNGSGKPSREADGEQTAILKKGGSGAKFTETTYTGRGQVATKTDPSGALTSWEHDRDDRVVTMRDPRAAGERREDFTIRYAYDGLGRLVSADLPPVTGQSRGRVTIAYDLRGNPVRRMDADGKTTEWTYDARNRKTSETASGADGAAQTMAWAYDEAGNVTREIAVNSLNTANPGESQGLVTVKEYDPLNRNTRITLPDGQETYSTYDKLGRLIQTRDAIGYVTSYQYNSQNLVILKEEPEGKTTRTQYNAWGNPTSTVFEGGAGGDQAWVRGYDARGQLSYERNNGGQKWTYAYDLRGLQVESDDPSGTTAVTVYSLTGLPVRKTLTNGGRTHAQSWTYDPAGALMSASDGAVVTAINQGSGSYVADPYDLVTSYATSVGGKKLALAVGYDKGLRPTSLTYPDGSAIAYAYDGLGRLSAIPSYATGGSYDFSGRLVSLDAANGTGRSKTWNAARGTLEGYQWTGTGKAARSLSWDTRGNLQSQTKDEGTASYTYDGQNRLSSSQEGWPVEVSTRDSDDTRYGVRDRDVAGRRALDYGQGSSTVKFDYSATSIGVDLGTTREINKLRLGAVGSRLSGRTVEVYVSDEGTSGSWTKVEDTTLTTDQEGTTVMFGSPVSAQYVKVHSAWDERDAENQSVDRSTISGTPKDLVEVWTTVNGQTTSWTYDGLGNRVSEYRYRGAGAYQELTYYPNTNLIQNKGEWEYNYDANGNLIERGTSGEWNAAAKRYDWDTDSGELWRYENDLKNRLVEVQRGKAGADSLKTVATFAYDSRDLRILTVKAGTTTYYQYDQSGDLVWTESGAETTKYIQALGQVWAEVRTASGESAVYYHHTDHLGTTELVTDEGGQVVWSGSYEAYGSVSRSNGSITFTPSYTGKQLDEDTGLAYFNARWYDADLGRFITEDPARDGDNWVAYVGNRPLVMVDPSGLEQSFVQRMFSGILSQESGKSDKSDIIKKNTNITVTRNAYEGKKIQGEKYYKDNISVRVFGIELNNIQAQTTVDWTKKYDASEATPNYSNQKATIGVDARTNKLAKDTIRFDDPKGNFLHKPISDGDRPFSGGCAIPPFESDVREVMNILRSDLGFNNGDKVNWIIAPPNTGKARRNIE